MIQNLLFAAMFAVPVRAQEIKNPDTYVFVHINEVDTLDPAWYYDAASHIAVLNIYEPLFFFDKSSTEKLVPLIATKVPSRENGLISKDGKTYTIPIRKNVKFHDGTPLTPEDIRYSIMRFMLEDRAAGPSSLLMDPLLGYPSTRDDKGNVNHQAYQDAANAVTVQGDNVVLRLPRPYAPLLSILASWAPAISKKWATDNGDWDGSAETWEKHNNPSKESRPFYERANGTGAFKLERWDRRTREMVLARNDNYWREPAKLKRVIMKTINEFATRKLMLAAGDADAIYAKAPEFSQLQNIPGVKIIDNLPTITMDPVAYFTFHVNTVGNPYIGSGELDGNGVPADFFADKDLRKAFAYAFDYKGYIADVYRGKGTQATGCIPKSLPGHNPKQPVYAYDMGLATKYFEKAMGGKVWKAGFKFTIAYNNGNIERQTLANILKRNIESINRKFMIDVRPVEWPTFLDAYKNGKLPVFILGWEADYPDAHNFVFPMLHSKGDYPSTQKYSNPAVDKLIERAKIETDAAKRKSLYAKVLEIEHEDVPHLVVVDSTFFRTQRDWLQGWYDNPVFPDAPYGCYYYPLWKGELPAAPAAAAKAPKKAKKKGK